MSNEKLFPQNEEQEHMVQILLAKIQGGYTVECYDPEAECWVMSDFRGMATTGVKYRIKPKETPLPIPNELWRYINPIFKYAAMDSDGCICFYRNKPHIGVSQTDWYEEKFSPIKNSSLIKISTDGIDWKASLTMRPEGL